MTSRHFKERREKIHFQQELQEYFEESQCDYKHILSIYFNDDWQELGEIDLYEDDPYEALYEDDPYEALYEDDPYEALYEDDPYESLYEDCDPYWEGNYVRLRPGNHVKINGRVYLVLESRTLADLLTGETSLGPNRVRKEQIIF